MRIGLSWLIIIVRVTAALHNDAARDSAGNAAQVEVRAVFINCEPDNRGKVSPDTEATRFEREELFKHSALQDCCKKLAVTVKIASQPNENSGDEYLPIEHVFEGANKKRVRLLDPYILRLRRELPLQAYKLRRLDTVTGILTSSDGDFLEKYKRRIARTQSDLDFYSTKEWTLNKTPASLYSSQENRDRKRSSSEQSSANQETMCTYYDTASKLRDKRNEHNVVVEDLADDEHSRWIDKDRYYQRADRNLETPHHLEKPSRIEPDGLIDIANMKPNSDKKRLHSEHRNRRKFRVPALRNTNEKINSKNPLDKVKHESHNENTKSEKSSLDVGDSDDRDMNNNDQFDDKYYRQRKSDDINNVDPEEKDFAVYEIGNPELWYNAHLQLFEKLSTPEGKTLWNDLTKGRLASVSTLAPEWTGQDLNVRYRPDEWLARDKYTLPATRLCLLAPIHDGNSDSFNDNLTSFNDGDYIVVPIEDIVGWQDDLDDLSKRNDNDSDTEYSTSTEQEQGNRKVIVRTSRALLKGSEETVNVASQGSDRYLTLPHLRLHHAQIDLEARADENELVRIGSSGRISTAVSDSTRRTRTVITVQAANTGLAAARFRVIARDCGPALSSLYDEKGEAAFVTVPELLPPMHTRNLRLELPVEIPLDSAHCSVALLNDDDESVAVRDVEIKIGDRCFCVWHCDCVCLGDDPKLLCREMAEARQAAAGLSMRDRSRHSRSICYKDSTTTNLIVVVLGVISFLFILGLIKAFLGLVFRCIGTWGLGRLLQTPRKLERYYEKSLASRPVEYDGEGWPVHPDTKARTVHLVSWPMEFVLNTIFFLSIPCILIQDAIKKCFARCTHADGQDPGGPNRDETKKCFSSHDMQSAVGRWRRRRGELRRWMTPGAQQLSAEIWQKGLSPRPEMTNEIMKPLLATTTERGGDGANETRESAPDSEQDDTDYVLTQMQKSRESLAKSQRKLSDPEHSTAKNK